MDSVEGTYLIPETWQHLDSIDNAMNHERQAEEQFEAAKLKLEAARLNTKTQLGATIKTHLRSDNMPPDIAIEVEELIDSSWLKVE